MVRTMVTGGAGFIGSNIVDMLLNEGHEVAVIDNLSTGQLANLPQNITFYEMDICSEKAKDCLLSFMPDIVVHTAAQISVHSSMKNPLEDGRVNLMGLLNLLQSFHGKKLPYWVFTSTGGAIYGEQETFPACETHPIRPDSVYGLAKYTSELYLDLWSRKFDLQYVALRLANVYGPRQNSHGECGVVAIFTEKLIRGEIPIIYGSGEQTRDFVYVGDVVNAVRLVVKDKITGVYNIGTGIETSINQIYQMLYELLDIHFPANHGPAKSGEQLRSCIDHSRAEKTFGWNPRIELREGLKHTTSWVKAYGKT